ncbi:Ig-like domain-containing protein [Nonomuraea sp. JJY05]|uniref:Ig-like domain-containing protein n=1 Tax=Nonomuraea sp. JJY05 TaxID=3350255 RepID=UPI00373E3FEE
MTTSRSASGLCPRARRRAALISALVLPITLVAAPATAQGPTPSPTPTPTGALSTLSAVDAAKAEAKKQGKQVEIPSLHTENMTTVANPDGKTVGTYVFPTPIRFKKGNGDWQAIDTTLIRIGDIVKPKALKDEVRLSAGGDTGLLRIKTSEGQTQLAATAKLSTPLLSGNTATYADAYGEGIDLVLQVTAAGIRQKIVIRQRPAERLTLRVSVDPGAGLKYRSKSGRAEVLDDGKKVADITPAVMLDAKATESAAVGKISRVDTALDGDDLVYNPDAAFLADPATTYPVTLLGNPTPWYGAGFPTDTFVSNDSRFTVGTGQQYMDALLAGRNNFDGETGSTYYIYRAYLKYDLTNAPWYGLPILNADVRPWNYITTHCGGPNDTPRMAVRRVTSNWALDSSSSVNLRWDRQPSVTITGEEVKGGGVGRIRKAGGTYINCSSPSQELYYSIEDIVRAWASGSPNYGLQIAAYGDSSGTSNFREFLSSEWSGIDGRGPVLFVEYEAPDPEVGVVGWFAPDEPGITDRAAAEAIADNPDLGQATETEPVADDVTDEQAVEEREASTDVQEITMQEAVEDDPIVDNPAPDTAPPTVIRTDPVKDATDGSTTALSVLFDEEVNNVQLVVKDSAGTAVAGAVAANHTSAGWTFTPNQPLANETAYAAEVSGATDAAGNAMSGAYSWTFTTAKDIPACSTAPSFERSKSYTYGDRVSYEGHLWEAQASGYLGVPGSELSFWEDLGPCSGEPNPDPTPACTAPAWNAALEYEYGDSVTYQGHTWEVIGEWVDAGVEPTTSASWEDLGACSGQPPTDPPCTAYSWSVFAPYYVGEKVTWEGHMWEATQNTTRGQEPGVHAAWKDLGACSGEPPLNIKQMKASTAVGLPDPQNVPPNAAGMFDRMTPEKCAARANLSGRGQGWIMNRFSWCQMGRLEAFYEKGGPFERYMADVMLIGYTFNGVEGRDQSKGDTARDIVIEAYVYNHNPYSLPPGRTMTLGMDIGNKTRCEHVTSRGGQTVDNRQTRLISSWIVDGHATFRFRCPHDKASKKRITEWLDGANGAKEYVPNDELVSFTSIKAYANFPNWPTTTRYKYVTNADRWITGTIIRCDSASDNDYEAGGCVFYKTKSAVKWQPKVTNKAGTKEWDITQAYQHYWNACVDPDGQTWPDIPGKSLGGCDISGSPSTGYLHKETKKQAALNQDATNTKCNRMWPGYASSGDYPKQCDEYPFASTRERTGAPNSNMWSFCPIRDTHNGLAGLYLKRYYHADRVLFGDKFSNRFVPPSSSDPKPTREQLCGIPSVAN